VNVAHIRIGLLPYAQKYDWGLLATQPLDMFLADVDNADYQQAV
jgi:hypothetical protein